MTRIIKLPSIEGSPCVHTTVASAADSEGTCVAPAGIAPPESLLNLKPRRRRCAPPAEPGAPGARRSSVTGRSPASAGPEPESESRPSHELGPRRGPAAGR